MRSLAKTLAGIFPLCSLDVTKAGCLCPLVLAAMQTKASLGTTGVGDPHGAFADHVVSPY